MALDKAILSGKEHRKMYVGNKTKSCYNHGSCYKCYCNRQYKNLKKEQKMLDRLNDF